MEGLLWEVASLGFRFVRLQGFFACFNKSVGAFRFYKFKPACLLSKGITRLCMGARFAMDCPSERYFEK